MALQKIFLYSFLSGILIVSIFAHSVDQNIDERSPSFSPGIRQELESIVGVVEPSDEFFKANRDKARKILLQFPDLSPDIRQKLERIAANGTDSKITPISSARCPNAF